MQVAQPFHHFSERITSMYWHYKSSRFLKMFYFTLFNYSGHVCVMVHFKFLVIQLFTETLISWLGMVLTPLNKNGPLEHITSLHYIHIYSWRYIYIYSISGRFYPKRKYKQSDMWSREQYNIISNATIQNFELSSREAKCTA